MVREDVMPWFRFTADFDFKPRAAVTIAYRSGSTKLVSRACAEQAAALGRGDIIERPVDGNKTQWRRSDDALAVVAEAGRDEP